MYRCLGGFRERMRRDRVFDYYCVLTRGWVKLAVGEATVYRHWSLRLSTLGAGFCYRYKRIRCTMQPVFYQTYGNDVCYKKQETTEKICC